MKTVSYNIPNINCNHCVHTIKTELLELQGVKSVEGNPDQKTIQVSFDAPANELEIENLLQEINYPIQQH